MRKQDHRIFPLKLKLEDSTNELHNPDSHFESPNPSSLMMRAPKNPIDESKQLSFDAFPFLRQQEHLNSITVPQGTLQNLNSPTILEQSQIVEVEKQSESNSNKNEQTRVLNGLALQRKLTLSSDSKGNIFHPFFGTPPTTSPAKLKRNSQPITSFTNLKMLRRNGLAPTTSVNKEIIGRITYMNMQSSVNSEFLDVGSDSQQLQPQSSETLPLVFMNRNKKLSASWQFINILVLIQKLTNKLRSQCSSYKFKRLTDAHYKYLSDKTEVRSWASNNNNSNNTNNTTQGSEIRSCIDYFEDFLLRIDLFKWIQERMTVLSPEQTFVIIWKSLMFVMLFSQVLYIPIKIAFFDYKVQLSEALEVLLSVVPFWMCICDILINFNLAFFSTEGVVVLDRKGIVENYMRFHFWLDVISTASLATSQLNFTDLCFLFRILQISEIINYLDECFQLSQRFNTVFTLMKLIATIITVAHIFGCGFYYMSLFDSNLNWVNSLRLDQPSWGTLYLKSIYFIIITMITVGFGDITPKNNAETIYILGIALLSCFQFGYTVNVIGSLFQEKAQEEANIKYFRANVSVKELRLLSKTTNRFTFSWVKYPRESLLFVTNAGFLKALTTIMSENTLIPGDYLYNRLDTHQSDRLYIIVKGRVDLTLSNFTHSNKSNFLVLHRNAGDMFGHVSFFSGNARETDAICATTSHVVFCSSSDFLETAKNFPLDYERFCIIREQISLYQQDKDTKCIGCDKFGHCIIDCPSIHFSRYKSQVIQKHSYSIEQKRNQNPHPQRRKSNCLGNLESIRMSLKKIRIKFAHKSAKKLMPKKKKLNQLPESSTDSSHISDYVKEVKIEKALKDRRYLLRLNNEESASSPMMNNHDKNFFRKHERINPLNINLSQTDDSEMSSDDIPDDKLYDSHDGVYVLDAKRTNAMQQQSQHRTRNHTINDSESEESYHNNHSILKRENQDDNYFPHSATIIQSKALDSRYKKSSNQRRQSSLCLIEEGPKGAGTKKSRFETFTQKKQNIDDFESGYKRTISNQSHLSPNSRLISQKRIPDNRVDSPIFIASHRNISIQRPKKSHSKQFSQHPHVHPSSTLSIDKPQSESDIRSNENCSLRVISQSMTINKPIDCSFSGNQCSDEDKVDGLKYNIKGQSDFKSTFLTKIASQRIAISKIKYNFLNEYEEDISPIQQQQAQMFLQVTPKQSQKSGAVLKTKTHIPHSLTIPLPQTSQHIPLAKTNQQIEEKQLKSTRHIPGISSRDVSRRIEQTPKSKYEFGGVAKSERLHYLNFAEKAQLQQQQQLQNREDDIFMLMDFEIQKSYKVYFPHNNHGIVLDSLAKHLIKKYITTHINLNQKGTKNSQKNITSFSMIAQQNTSQLAGLIRKKSFFKIKKLAA